MRGARERLGAGLVEVARGVLPLVQDADDVAVLRAFGVVDDVRAAAVFFAIRQDAAGAPLLFP